MISISCHFFKNVWSDNEYSSEPVPYDYFRSKQEFSVQLVCFFSRTDAKLMGIHFSIKMEVGFVRPQNVPWPGLINRHSQEVARLLCEYPGRAVPIVEPLEYYTCRTSEFYV